MVIKTVNIHFKKKQIEEKDRNKKEKTKEIFFNINRNALIFFFIDIRFNFLFHHLSIFLLFF
jgi:hypothetical protein